MSAGFVGLGSLNLPNVTSTGLSESPTANQSSYDDYVNSVYSDALQNYANLQAQGLKIPTSAASAVAASGVTPSAGQTIGAIGDGIANSTLPGASILGGALSSAGKNLSILSGHSLGDFVGIIVGVVAVGIGLLMFKQTSTVIGHVGRGAARVAELAA